MRHLLRVLAVSVALLAASATSASAKPPLPCDYWVHGCNPLGYVCDTGICDAVPAPAAKP